MSRRQLPDDCPCPWARHNDGNPHIQWPDPACPHHGRRPAPTATPIRKTSRT